MKARRIFAPIAAVCLFVAVITACGANSGNSSSSSTSDADFSDSLSPNFGRV